MLVCQSDYWIGKYLARGQLEVLWSSKRTAGRQGVDASYPNAQGDFTADISNKWSSNTYAIVMVQLARQK